MSRFTDSLIRRDFPSFVHECHKICRGGKTLNNDPYLLLAFAMAEEMIAGVHHRLIVNLPPGTAKSFIFATCLPAWMLANDPSASVLVVEHSKKLARDTTRNIRRIFCFAVVQAQLQDTHRRKMEGCRRLWYNRWRERLCNVYRWYHHRLSSGSYHS